jgi:beta-galactosidase
MSGKSMIKRISVALLFAILATSCCWAQSRHSFGVSDGDFVLDGKPFQIISGEMHYPRIPREYWHDRLKKARAMGLNTITTYVFWNLHEPKPGVYDFSGQNDVAAFIRAAQEEGLYVILRPGPYVCAEWDLGGLPAWLLADPTIVLRSTDEKFMIPAEQWLKRLGKELAPLQITRGGPIIAVQVENEYGSFDSDKEYLGSIRKAIVDAGLGEAMQYTADGPEQLPKGTLPDLPAVVNFGPGEAKFAFQKLTAFRPNQPLMSGEYWAGWFDQWGQKHAATNAPQQEKELDWILSHGYSINFYMFHGGTSFGFMNGANYDGEYRPQTTSYDYDAALDESGRPTQKYFAFREIIARHRAGVNIPQTPETQPAIVFAPVQLSNAGSLWDNLGSPTTSPTPKTMEQLGQSYGYILYRHQLDGPADGELKLGDLQDFAEIFIDGQHIGSLDRRLKQTSLPIHVSAARVRLDILVENSGRINFTKRLRSERKGITVAELNGKPLESWDIYPLPMTDVAHLRSTTKETTGPAFYRASFRLSKPGDTFLDTRSLIKGVAWVNGHLMGRFWSIGPQQTLYVPAPWLKSGENEVLIFDLEGRPNRTVQGLNKPILDEIPQDEPAAKH